MKRHELAYDTAAGEVLTNVSLRQCHPILMLDNLVRFSDKPGKPNIKTNPGVRGNQLCTLPLTIQGLPDRIVEQWHEPDCLQTVDCHCKQSQTLSRQDVD